MKESKNVTGTLRVEKSLLEQAKNNNFEAIVTMFHQFIETEEEILFAEYLGIKGLWGIGHHSFACLTNRRLATIQTGTFGEVIYQDGYLEELNSCVIYQPSILWLYISAFIVAVFTFGIGLLLLPFLVKTYYSFKKCGAVFWIKEGVPIYIFSDRKRLSRINHFNRTCPNLRDKRIAYFYKH